MIHEQVPVRVSVHAPAQAARPALSRRRLLSTGVTLAAGAVVGTSSGCAPRRFQSPIGPTVGPSATGGGAVRYFPPATGEWETVDPAALRWNTDALRAFVELVEQRRSRGLVVLSGGRIAVERYWGVDAQRSRDVASVQKSIVSLLVGIAAAAGRLRLDDPVTRWLGAGWSASGTAADAITLRHLLEMASGLDEALKVIAPPGTVWFYNTPAYALLHPVLERAYGESLQALSARLLFKPCGLSTGHWESRHLGTPASGRPAPAEQALILTPREMARLGLLVLAGGRWADMQVVPAAHLGDALRTSQPMNPSYGWLWWLNGQPSYLLPGTGRPRVEHSLIASAPVDLVAALGAGDQKIHVVASRGIVLVRQGEPARGLNDANTAFDEELWAALSRALP